MLGLVARFADSSPRVVRESHIELLEEEEAVYVQRGCGSVLELTCLYCPVNFESLNYTIITSKCKGPQYPAKLCCPALQEFACPYVDEVNDLTNDCASTMFSYINLYGKYPTGLFASECRDAKEGLTCDALPPAASDNANGALIGQTVPHFLMLLVGSLILLIQML
ncbi:hypothetical protein NE237_015521 [Protea cynaroides]|uniref:GPI-anchored protein LLG1-like domain-containing protein n=1 Tax=Protea cynaroides TaxID=273540 RepID=A0A9Q0QR54_9MAGN|nr:hypothetical protein NE237_015521 [Protea cynaroides]